VLELETQVLIADQLRYLENKDTHNLLEQAADAGRILNGLLASIPNQGEWSLNTDH